jgi:hypothetical protein
MAVILSDNITYGKDNRSDMLSGSVIAQPGLRLIDTADLVGPTYTNRPLINLAESDQEINYHLEEMTTLFKDGVFPMFGEAFLPVRTSDITGSSVTFEIREGLGKIGNQAFHLQYEANTTYEYDYDPQTRKFLKVAVAPVITSLSIDVTGIGVNQYRRDLIVMTNTGEIQVIQGTNSTTKPGMFSQLDAPTNTIALYSILFRKISGILQTPEINPSYDAVSIEGIELIQKFADLFGDGIFRDEPITETNPLKKEFTPELIGGTNYFINPGLAMINGKLIRYGDAGGTISLPKYTINVGTGLTPGASQGQNTNNWELVDFTSTTAQGAAGVGNGNIQYLKFDNLLKTGYIDPASITIYTAALTGEGGYVTPHSFDLDPLAAPGLEEYSIDASNGFIRREQSTAPLQVYIKYAFSRNVNYLPYLKADGTLATLVSAPHYPEVAPEFAKSGLPENTIGFRSIQFNAVDPTLQQDSFGTDFRKYIDFKLEDGQITTRGIQDGAITSPKIADNAISKASQVSGGVIIQNHLSEELLNSLGSSRVYIRSSFAFKRNADNIYTFVDNKDGANNTFFKKLIDLTGADLVQTDAELQSPSNRPIVNQPIFANNTSTQATLDPSQSRATFSISQTDVAGITLPNNQVPVDSVAVSFADFGFNQAGNAIVIVYDPANDLIVGQATEAIITIKNTVNATQSGFYKFTLASPINLTIGKNYEIRIAKVIPTDTLFVHTSIDGPTRSNFISYKIYYKPAPGRYGLIGNNLQAYKLYDDFGDITVPSIDREATSRPSFYIPYAASISDPDSFNVYSNIDNTVSNYVAVDLIKGVIKFASGSEPANTKLYVDCNITQGYYLLSSARIHRDSGQTIEHALRVLETELSSVRANIKNNLELLYALGNGKFRFSLQDRQLTNLAGDPLKLVDGNLLNVVHVIDRQYVIPEGRESKRSLQSAFSNTDYIEFTPRFDNIAIIAINIEDVGSVYDNIQISLFNGAKTTDSFNNVVLATSFISRAAIKQGVNYFQFSIGTNIGQPYHAYIKVNGFTVGTRPSIKVDVENGAIEYYTYFLPVPGKYGTANGFSVLDIYGDLTLGAEQRGSSVDSSQENFLDLDGAQVQPFFDDNNVNPEAANTTFPVFAPSKPTATGMVRFDIYFKTVPAEGQDGFNGSFRLQLHNSSNEAIIPNNAKLGQNYIDVKIPKTAGWMEIPFIASLKFGESYHMHIWANGFDLTLYVGTHPVNQKKAFRYIAGDRFILFAADLSGDKFDTFEIVSRNLAAVDVITGRIKFHPDDVKQGNRIFANFNLSTKNVNLQSDTIVRPNGETIENALININSVLNATPKRLAIDEYQFNNREIEMVDSFGRTLELSDAELTVPYARATIADTDITGSPATVTAIEGDNTYTLFVDYHTDIEIPEINLNFNDVSKTSNDVYLNIYKFGTNTLLKQAYIKASDLVVGTNNIVLETISGQPLNFIAEPNVQYEFRYAINTQVGSSAPKLSRNANNVITTTIFTKPLVGGSYGTENGMTIVDEFGDVFRFNTDRDEKINATTFASTSSGLLNLKVTKGTTKGFVTWEENGTYNGIRYDLATGNILDASKLNIAGDGYVVSQTNSFTYEDITYTTWVQSGAVYGRRLFLNNSDPFTIDTSSYKLSDTGATSGVANPAIAVSRDRLMVAWEDGRHSVISGDVSATPNASNIFTLVFKDASKTAQFNPSSQNDNVSGLPVRINNQTILNSRAKCPQIAMWHDDAVIVYQSDKENVGLSNDIQLSLYNTNTKQLVRSDVKVDKAPRTDVSLQLDSKKPKLSSNKNRHFIVWMDNRNSVYNLYGKVYDSNALTFEGTDVLLDDTLSGVLNFSINTDEKNSIVSFVDIDDSYKTKVLRYDFGSLTPHDARSFNYDFNNNVAKVTDECATVVNNKIVDTFALSKASNLISYSRIIGDNKEPISVDLTDISNIEIRPGYIGIDVKNGTFKFANNEEI